ncbi:histidine kinase, partial [Microbacterium sp. SUBG005]
MPIRLAAAALLGLEAIGILALAGWQTVALIGGDTDSVVSSIALIVLTVI